MPGSWGEIGHTVGSMFAPLIADHVEAWTRHVIAETGRDAPRRARGGGRISRADAGARAVPLGEIEGMGSRRRALDSTSCVLLQARAEVLRA